MAALDEPDDQRNDCYEKEQGNAKNQPNPGFSLKGCGIAPHGGTGLPMNRAAEGSQIPANLGAFAEAHVTGKDGEITSYGGSGLNHDVALKGGDVATDLSADVDRAAKTGEIGGLFTRGDSDIVAKLGVLGIGFGQGRWDGSAEHSQKRKQVEQWASHGRALAPF